MNHSKASVDSLTRKILLWMGLGAITGILINQFFSDAPLVQDYLVGGALSVVGTLFVKSLKMLVVPLVFFSLFCGVCGLGDIKLLGRVGLKTFLFYLSTTAIAISVSLSLALLLNPGVGFDLEAAQSTFTGKEAPPLSQIITDLIPGNPIDAFADGNMLQIIFFTILFGICTVMLGERAKSISKSIQTLNDIMMKMVSVLMQIAPYGVAALIAKTFATQGLSALLPMLKYFLIVIAALLIHGFLVLPSLLFFIGRLNPVCFIKKMLPNQLFAFSTASSNATIPITLKTVEEKLGVHNSTASFTIPFGATINMDGTAIMQGVATVFIANAYGIAMEPSQYLTVIGMSVLASIGTAGVPGVGLIMLAMVLQQVGLPVEGIGLILGVDRLLDMVRTAVNVTGDAAVTCVVSRGEKKLDLEQYNRVE